MLHTIMQLDKKDQPVSYGKKCLCTIERLYTNELIYDAGESDRRKKDFLNVAYTKDNMTPLMRAVQNSQRSETLEWLIEKGALPNVGGMTRLPLTPLHIACMKSNKHLLVVLLKHGADKKIEGYVETIGRNVLVTELARICHCNKILRLLAMQD